MVCSLYTCLYCSVDHGYQHCCAKALPEVALDFAWQAGASELIGAWRIQRNDDPCWCARFCPHHEHSRLSLLYLPACLTNELATALEQHDLAVRPKGVCRCDTRGHSRQCRIDGG